MRRKGFTLIEAIICILIITIITIAYCRFDITVTNNLISSSEKADEILTEYQDVMNVRAGELSDINSGNWTLVQSDGSVSLYKYQGEYFEYYRVVN